MKIKFDSDDNLPLNKQLKFPTMAIILTSVFEEDGKYYPQVYLDEFFYELQMLEYDRIDISEGIDISKTNALTEYDICNHWYFLSKNFNCEPYLCNGCHDLMQKAKNFNDVAIVFAKGIDHRIHFWYMSKNDAINMNNSNLNEKRGVLSFYLLCIKMSKKTYYQKNRYLILNTAKEYYGNDKERLKNQGRDKY